MVEKEKFYTCCTLSKMIATSRAFNRYRGLYTMPTLDDMVQEAFIGMLAYKDDFTGEPGEVIFKAIRKHFKIKYREANAAARDFDNGRHNARIEPKAKKPPKVLIDELDYDPAKEPESVKQANNIKNWRLGGITIMKESRAPLEGLEQTLGALDRGTIYFYDEIEQSKIILKPKRLVIENATINNYPCIALWPENKRPGKQHKPEMLLHVPFTYQVDPYFHSFKELANTKEYLVAGGKWYKQTQTKTADLKLKIEKEEKPFTKKRDNPLELVSLLHAGYYPGYQTIKANYIPSDCFTAAPWSDYRVCFFCSIVLPSIIQSIEKPGSKKKLYFPPGAISYNRSVGTDYIIGRLDLIAMLREALYIINTMPQGCIMKLYYYQGMTQGDICALLYKSTRKVQLAREAGLEVIKPRFIVDIESILTRIHKLILKGEILPL